MSIPVLQELRVHVKSAIAIAEDIAARFSAGDPAPELLDRLAAVVAEIQLLRSRPDLHDLPEHELAELQARVNASVRQGDHWLSQVAGPALEVAATRERLAKAYRPPP